MENKKDAKFALATLILIVPCAIANVWFLQQMWNLGVLCIFPSLPIFTYRMTFALYFLMSIFGLHHSFDTGYYIKSMITEGKSQLEVNTYCLMGGTLFYLLSWLIITKVIF